MNRRDLVLSAAALSLAPCAAFGQVRIQAGTLAGDWSGVIPGPRGAGVMRFRIGADGRVVGLPGATVTPTGALLENTEPATRAAARTRVEYLTPERLRVRWLDSANPGVLVGRVAGPERIEAALSTPQLGATAFAATYTRGLTPASLAPSSQALTDLSLEAIQAANNLPAVTASAQRAGGAARTWRIGERLKGSGVAVEENDLWHLGSITKWLTGTLVARLVEADLVSWDDKVGDVLARLAPDMRRDYREVRLRHLLAHQGGIQRDVTAMENITHRAARDVAASRASVVRSVLRRKPVGPIGGAATYSNLGYVAVAAMLDVKLGRPWEELIRTHLFDPLGLSTAGFGPPRGDGPRDQPRGHVNGRPVGASEDNIAAYNSAGRVHMRMADLMTFLAANRDRSSLLRPETWRAVHTPVLGTNGNALAGCGVRADGALNMNGSNTMWYASAFVSGDRQVIAAAAANAASTPLMRLALHAAQSV